MQLIISTIVLILIITIPTIVPFNDPIFARGILVGAAILSFLQDLFAFIRDKYVRSLNQDYLCGIRLLVKRKTK